MKRYSLKQFNEWPIVRICKLKSCKIYFKNVVDKYSYNTLVTTLINYFKLALNKAKKSKALGTLLRIYCNK